MVAPRGVGLPEASLPAEIRLHPGVDWYDFSAKYLDDSADFDVPADLTPGQTAAVQDAGEGSLIWVDTDGCVSVEEFCDLFLTSVMKNMDVAVHDTVTAAAQDNFEGGAYVGTLENDGVGIAPFNEFEDVSFGGSFGGEGDDRFFACSIARIHPGARRERASSRESSGSTCPISA